MKKRNSERGQSLVELSISLVVLLLLLSGAVEFGLAFFQFVQLRDAAQEGALFGSMDANGLNIPNIETRARNASTSPIDLGDTSIVSVSIYINDALARQSDENGVVQNALCGQEGDALRVEVSYDHVVFMPFMANIIGNTVPLNATVTDTILSPVTCTP